MHVTEAMRCCTVCVAVFQHAGPDESGRQQGSLPSGILFQSSGHRWDRALRSPGGSGSLRLACHVALFARRGLRC